VDAGPGLDSLCIKPVRGGPLAQVNSPRLWLRGPDWHLAGCVCTRLYRGGGPRSKQARALVSLARPAIAGPNEERLMTCVESLR
jgi:hypothetical protein